MDEYYIHEIGEGITRVAHNAKFEKMGLLDTPVVILEKIKAPAHMAKGCHHFRKNEPRPLS